VAESLLRMNKIVLKFLPLTIEPIFGANRQDKTDRKGFPVSGRWIVLADSANPVKDGAGDGVPEVVFEALSKWQPQFSVNNQVDFLWTTKPPLV
jgi:hypothetical protein